VAQAPDGLADEVVGPDRAAVAGDQERVAPGPAGDRGGAVQGEAVVARAAVGGAVGGEEDVVVGADQQRVVAVGGERVAAGEDVVAVEALQEVGAGAADQRVGAAGAGQVVVPLAALQAFDVGRDRVVLARLAVGGGAAEDGGDGRGARR
jgi:hypothetical protein